MKTTIFTTLVTIFVCLNWVEIQGAPRANAGSNCPAVRDTIKKRFRRAAFNTDGNTKEIQIILRLFLKALVVKNSVLHNFGFGKVIHETFLMELQLFGWRRFSKTEVVQNTVLNH